MMDWQIKLLGNGLLTIDEVRSYLFEFRSLLEAPETALRLTELEGRYEELLDAAVDEVLDHNALDGAS